MSTLVVFNVYVFLCGIYVLWIDQRKKDSLNVNKLISNIFQILFSSIYKGHLTFSEGGADSSLIAASSPEGLGRVDWNSSGFDSELGADLVRNQFCSGSGSIGSCSKSNLNKISKIIS